MTGSALNASTLPSATGDLWASGSNATALLYDLPLSANLIPALASLGGPAALGVTLTLGDAAGNVQTQSGGTFMFHVIGPPLAIAEDTTFPASADLRSAYPYRVNDPLYAQLFQPGAPAFLPENAVRLLRYRVTNPSPTNVALTLPSIAAAWSATEIWAGFGIATGVTRTGCGDPSTGMVTNDNPTTASGGLVSFAYNEILGIDSTPAQKTVSGQVIVPAATSTSPGVVTLYIARPLPAGLRTYPLPWNGSRFEIALGSRWEAVATSGLMCCEWDRERFPPRCIQPGFRLAETQYSVFRDLIAGAESLVGTFSLVTQGLTGTTPIGETSTSPGTVTVTRTIQH